MAQQTQIETVIPYFERFVKRYPTIHDLAATDSDTLHKMVEGIGYYRRFQLMHEAAKLIVNTYNEVFPDTYEEVKSLPGVGDYTAGAIMSIAFNQPTQPLMETSFVFFLVSMESKTICGYPLIGN